MHPDGWRDKAYKYLSRGTAVISLLILVVGATLKVPLDKTPEVMQPMLGFLQSTAWLSILMLTLAFWGINFIIGYWGRPQTWQVVQSLLDTLRAEAFGQCDGLNQHHRVTLFQHHDVLLRPWKLGIWWKCHGIRSPWGGWLVPVARSGHTAKHSDSVFLAPDDGDLAQGVAGTVWATNGNVVVENLPDLNGSSSEEDKSRYCQEGHVTREWINDRIEKGRGFPRAIYGVPVEFKGRPWGVLIFDSRKETINKKALDSQVRMASKLLSKLVEAL